MQHIIDNRQTLCLGDTNFSYNKNYLETPIREPMVINTNNELDSYLSFGDNVLHNTLQPVSISPITTPLSHSEINAAYTHIKFFGNQHLKHFELILVNQLLLSLNLINQIRQPVSGVH